MHHLVAICLLAVTANGTTVPPTHLSDPPATQPALKKTDRGSGGLKLYNEKGERIAQCERKGESFTNCKIDSGATLDDVMNAWEHALEDFGK
jgi:hypothetical protein